MATGKVPADFTQKNKSVGHRLVKGENLSQDDQHNELNGNYS